jgi:hypothetical protein
VLSWIEGPTSYLSSVLPVLLNQGRERSSVVFEEVILWGWAYVLTAASDLEYLRTCTGKFNWSLGVSALRLPVGPTVTSAGSKSGDFHSEVWWRYGVPYLLSPYPACYLSQ